MTIIAIRDNVVACDSLISWGTLNYANAKKIRRLCDGSIIGVSGDVIPSTSFMDYMDRAVRDGERITPEALRRFAVVAALWLTEEGVILVDCKRTGSGMIKLEGDFFAEGSGATAALGAMHGGASARRAVSITCRVDTSCALPVQWMRFTGTKTRRSPKAGSPLPSPSKQTRSRKPTR